MTLVKRFPLHDAELHCRKTLLWIGQHSPNLNSTFSGDRINNRRFVEISNLDRITVGAEITPPLLLSAPICHSGHRE